MQPQDVSVTILAKYIFITHTETTDKLTRNKHFLTVCYADLNTIGDKFIKQFINTAKLQHQHETVKYNRLL